jgi:hypothetical protein
VSALFVNAYDIAFEGDVILWRFPRPDGMDKRDAELAAGVSLWTDADTFWCTRSPIGTSQSRSVTLPTADPGGLLGGIPWIVQAPADDHDLIIGIGRRDVGVQDQRRRIFGYAVTFISNDTYRQTWSFTPAADETTYLTRLGETVQAALRSDLDVGPNRLVIHLSRRTGVREIDVVQRAMKQVEITLPTTFLRLDDTTMWDSADTADESWVVPKGQVVQLSRRRALLHTEELGATGPPPPISPATSENRGWASI